MPTVDRLRRAIEAVVESVLRPRIDYLALYPSTVVTQTAAGLELLPDDERFRGQGLTDIPIRHGLPGFTVEVPVGVKVLLGFEAGDPARPYAALWEAGSVTTITYDGGSASVARTGDGVGRLYIDATQWAANVAAGSIVAPHLYYYDGFAWLPVVYSAGPPVSPSVGTVMKVTSGNTKFLA